jgi:signal transduction histidine kinase
LPRERVAELASRILAGVNRVEGLTQSLVDFAHRPDTSAARLAGEDLDLAALARRIIDEQQPHFPGRPIRLVTRGNLSLRWDRARLGHILNNLVSHAARHAIVGGTPGGAAALPPAAVTVTIDGATGRSASGEVTIAVHAAGYAVPERAAPGLLDPLVSSQPLAPLAAADGMLAGGEHESRGGGVGLFVAAQLTAALGGSIAVSSKPREGTTFLLRFERLGVTAK